MQDFLTKIISFIRELLRVFSHLQRRLTEKFSDPNSNGGQASETELAGLARYTGVSGFVFLRLICPAILGPKLFYIVRGEPNFFWWRWWLFFWWRLLIACLFSVHWPNKLYSYFCVVQYKIEHPEARAHRTLTLIAKSLQGLANLVTFGSKESWMVPMNEFITVSHFSFFALEFCELLSRLHLLYAISAYWRY